uniref:Uncharacterized protein n=1 Tax=viral metagenome TaxID=1070528 RepID=A0A6H1ZCD4_9ZZZZ
MISQADVRTILDFYKGNLIVQSEDEFDNPLSNIVGMLPYVNLLREICAVIKEYNETVEEAEEFIKDKSRNYESELFCVNVKRYADSTDLEEILDKMNVGSKEREYIIDNIDIDSMYEYWLDDHRRYIIDNFIEGGIHFSRKWMEDNVKPKILKGEKTGYPYLDKIRGKQKKLIELEKWIERDIKESGYLELFENAGFYGSSGGWFGACLSDKLEDDFDVLCNLSLDDPIGNASYFETYGERDICSLRGTVEDMKYKMEAIEWLLDYVKNYNDTLVFEEELKYRVAEIRKEYKNG